MLTSITLPTSHHFHLSLSSVVSFSLGILHELMRTQMLAKPSSNLLQTWRWPLGWLRTTLMKNIHDDLSSLDLGIHEARDMAQNRPLWRLMSFAQRQALVVSGACYYWLVGWLLCHCDSKQVHRLRISISHEILYWMEYWIGSFHKCHLNLCHLNLYLAQL